MKSLVVLGNGTSLKNIDFNLLTDQDTIGLNGGYIKYQQDQWFPKYYAFLPKGPQHWKWEDIEQFILRNRLKIDKFFFFENNRYNLSNAAITDKIVFLKHHFPSDIKFDMSKYSLPISVEIGIAMDRHKQNLLKNKVPELEAEQAIWRNGKFLHRAEIFKQIQSLNFGGILKILEGNEILLNDNDRIRLPRYKASWFLPHSFDDFVLTGGNAGVVATLIGYVMGYKKIILLGMDCNWKTQNDVVDTKSTYWFDQYFNNKQYNIKDFCSQCTEESLQKMHLDAWLNLKESFEVNNVEIEIVNCSEGSALTYFRQSTLEGEL